MVKLKLPKQLPKLPKLSHSVAMLLLQCLAVLSILYGVSWYSIPISMIVGGMACIVAVERQHETDPNALDDRAIKARIDDALMKGNNPFTDPGVPIDAKWLGYIDAIRKR